MVKMRKADYDQYYDDILIVPDHIEAGREIELQLSQAVAEKVDAWKNLRHTGKGINGT